MTKSYAPPLTTNPHGPLYRVDKAIRAAQQRLDAAIDAKRHHTNQNLAHEVIKEHAVSVALGMREQGAVDNDLLDRLAADDRLPLDRPQLDALVGEPLSFVGTAVAQVGHFTERVAAVVARHPDAAAYESEDIL